MHLFVDRSPEPGFGAFVAAHHAFVVPTLRMLQSAVGAPGQTKSLAADKRMTDYLAARDTLNLGKTFGGSKVAHYEATGETIRQLKAAHADVLAGTDAPNPGTMFGASMPRQAKP